MPVRTRGNAKAKRRAWRATGPGAPDREGGFALILVISVMTALLLGALVAVQNVTGYLPVAGTDVQRQAALAAAEAGVDDYLNRLNQDPNYWSDESGNVAMQPNGWVKVCDSCIGEFHYSVSTADMLDYHETNTLTGSWGTIYLKSTGKVGNVTRTVEVGMREDFLKNLYLSEYNIVDPEMMTLEWAGDHSAPTLTQLEDYCSVYAYQHNTYSGGTGPDMNTIPGTDESCYGLINYWVSGQTVNGPMQANDEYYIIGNPDFTQAVSTADFNVPGDSPYWEDPTCGGFPTPLRCGGDSPTFNPTYNPGGVPIGNGGTVSLPASIFGSSSTSVSNNVAAPGTLGATEGCEYYGPTVITFLDGTFGQKQMEVYSPLTQALDQAVGSPCVGTGATPWNVPLNLPANGLIYVANQPGQCTADPTPTWAVLGNAGGCQGNAFVGGEVDGQVTIAADNNIYLVAPSSQSASTIIGAEYMQSGGDVMGLEATHFVLINHDTSGGSQYDTFGPLNFWKVMPNVTINAAVYSLNDSLGEEAFWQTMLGNLVINGAVIGVYMDIEGTTAPTGYNETYNWDSRLAQLTPPFFNGDGTTWTETSFAEIAACSPVSGC